MFRKVADIRWTAWCAGASPRAAPEPAKSALPASICRTCRPRVAPSDDRTASSLARSVARANCMFITLTHAMGGIPTQHASIVHIIPRSCTPVYWLSSGSTSPAVYALFVSG